MFKSIFLSYFAFSRPQNTIYVLDALRAFAIILVLARHGVRPLVDDNPDALSQSSKLSTPLLNGWVGVDLFFVLSGFLITSHLIRQVQITGGINWRKYLLARVLRIVPAYIAIIVLVSIGSFPFFQPTTADNSYLIHLFFLQDYLGADIIVALWSLGVEEKFYLLAPLLVGIALTSSSLRLRYLCLVTLCFLPCVARLITMQFDASEQLSYEEFFLRYRSPFHVTFDGLSMGVLVAFLVNDRINLSWIANVKSIRLIYWISLITLIGLLVHQDMMESISAFDILLQPFIIAAAFAGLTYSLLNRPNKKTRIIGHRYVFYISKLSYVLYLVHMPLIPLSIHMSMSEDGTVNSLMFFSFYLILSFAFSLVLHFSVEKPFLILKDRLSLTATTRTKQNLSDSSGQPVN